MGNDLALAREHNVRLWAAHKSFIGHNILRGKSSDGNRHSLKLHSGGYRDYSDRRDMTMGKWASSQVVVANNVFGDLADNNSWTVALSPQNNLESEGLEDIVLEGNRFFRGDRTNTEAVIVGRRMTSRGNSRIDGRSPNINSAPTVNWATSSDWRGPYFFLP
jgi:hypothetical protein